MHVNEEELLFTKSTNLITIFACKPKIAVQYEHKLNYTITPEDDHSKWLCFCIPDTGKRDLHLWTRCRRAFLSLHHPTVLLTQRLLSLQDPLPS